jgi:hypothetical protein
MVGDVNRTVEFYRDVLGHLKKSQTTLCEIVRQKANKDYKEVSSYVGN